MNKLALIAILLFAPAAYAGDHTITKNSPGCMSKELLDKLATTKSEGDEVAFKKLLLVASASGNCVVLSKGESVFLQDVSWSGYVKVRREGDLTEYWTLEGAIQ